MPRTPFDGRALVREWGWIGRSGAVRETGFETESTAIETGAKVRQRKKKRGYQVLADTKNQRNPSCPDDNLA